MKHCECPAAKADNVVGTNTVPVHPSRTQASMLLPVGSDRQSAARDAVASPDMTADMKWRRDVYAIARGGWRAWAHRPPNAIGKK